MKKLLAILLISPIVSSAQNSTARFENDTLHTSGGYKIYKGQTLQLANGTSAAGYFTYIKFHSNMGRNDTYILQNSTVLVEKLKNFKNADIRLTGTANLTDGRKLPVDLIIDVEKAAETNGELTVPATYINKTAPPKPTETKKQPVAVEAKKETAPADLRKIMVADEIKKLFDLYKAGALTKEEYEAQKKKLLERQ